MEKVYKFNQSAEKLIEKNLDDDVAMINHMILNQGDTLPKHDANSNVYMIIIRGIITVELAGNPATSYEHGSIINIPYGTTMNISNRNSEQAEFFVVKSPSPRRYK